MKKKYYIIILVMILILSLIGVSYAYFQIVDKSEANTHIYGQTPGGKIILTDVTSNLHLNIKASDMTLSNENKVYYADDTENYVTNINDATHTIASITLSETEDTYDCVGDITVTLNIDENSMGKVLEENDLILNINGSSSNYTIDLSELKELGTNKYNLVFSIDKNTTEEVQAYVQLNNKQTSQIYLAGKELSINIKVDNIVCNPSKTGADVVEEVLGTVPVGLKTDKLLGGLYRFVGACNAAGGGCTDKVNNFVCFGTDTPESDCNNQVDSEYMYRIIGIDSDTGDLKLIKNTGIRESSTTGFQWHNSESTDTEWPNSDLYKRLNGLDSSYSKLFIDATSANAKYLTKGSKWYDMIKDTDWLYGDIGYNGSIEETNKTAEEVYAIETGAASTHTGTNTGEYTWNKLEIAKIGLMNVSDYYYSKAGNKSENCYSDTSCKTSWLHISNNGKIGESSYEWTMLRLGKLDDGVFNVWTVESNGGLGRLSVWEKLGVRPIFFLDSSKIKISGNGTVIDPFVVS